jgi:YbbR domain-containing protein
MSDFFLRNFWLKLASLILATLIWLTVQANLDKETRGVYPDANLSDELDKRVVTQKRFELPVTILSEGSNSAIYRSIPTNVTVTFSGEAVKINGLEERELLAFVDAGGVTDRQHEVFPVLVNAPSGVSLLRVIPPVIRLKLAPKP